MVIDQLTNGQPPATVCHTPISLNFSGNTHILDKVQRISAWCGKAHTSI